MFYIHLYPYKHTRDEMLGTNKMWSPCWWSHFYHVCTIDVFQPPHPPPKSNLSHFITLMSNNRWNAKHASFGGFSSSLIGATHHTADSNHLHWNLSLKILISNIIKEFKNIYIIERLNLLLNTIQSRNNLLILVN